MEHEKRPAPAEGLDTEPLITLGAGFMAGKLVCVGNEFGIFERLADGPRSIEDISAASGLPARSVRVLVHGLYAIIHLLDPEKIGMVLRRIREVVQPGARLLVVDQWMDDTHGKPVLGAMLAALYLLLSGDGATYSVAEAEPRLRDAGFRVVEHRPLAGETSLLIAEAT